MTNAGTPKAPDPDFAGMVDAYRKAIIGTVVFGAGVSTKETEESARSALLARYEEMRAEVESAKLAERKACADLAHKFAHHALWPDHCGISYGWTQQMEELGVKLAIGIAKAIDVRTRHEEIERKFSARSTLNQPPEPQGCDGPATEEGRA